MRAVLDGLSVGREAGKHIAGEEAHGMAYQAREVMPAGQAKKDSLTPQHALRITNPSNGAAPQREDR
jgi:hypothetical protein